MNFLQRSLIEKAGYDNGWEVVVHSDESAVSLSSSLHQSRARITKNDQSKWELSFNQATLSHELRRSTGQPENQRFLAANDSELGVLLSQAARLARTLPNQPEKRFAQAVQEELEKGTMSQTEVERFVKQRIGQTIFRESLMDYWDGACSVTGIQIPELLRASHIKAWADCDSDSERLNVFNGLLLSANLDALFEVHWFCRTTDSLLLGMCVGM